MMITALKMTAERIRRGREVQLHHVEGAEVRVYAGEHRREDREVLGDVVGDGERRQRASGRSGCRVTTATRKTTVRR
jgi:hypothetical protein